jgi:peptidoglycan/xylan/chitin deacetylase (PgdA/CDA1 family)
VILGYHGVGTVRRADDVFLLQLNPDRFRAQMEMLLDAGFRLITVAEFAEMTAPAGSRPPPPGFAAVSFDDAMANNLTIAQPILADLGVVATVYVPTGWLGGHSPWLGPGADGAIMTALQLLELHRAGWELGAHTVTHADLSQLDYAGCVREISQSCETLKATTGADVRTLAYPFGRYGPEAVAAAQDCGLIAAVTTGSGRWDRFELTRAMVGAADPFFVLALKLTDRYEPLLSSPPLRIVRELSKQARRRLIANREAG